jgi:hypothetical protein
VISASHDPQAMPSRNLPTDATGNPHPKAQRNHRCAEGFAYTDPDSHILNGGDGWIQGYNCQAVVVDATILDRLERRAIGPLTLVYYGRSCKLLKA